jgi:hypothetical protein
MACCKVIVTASVRSLAWSFLIERRKDKELTPAAMNDRRQVEAPL